MFNFIFLNLSITSLLLLSFGLYLLLNILNSTSILNSIYNQILFFLLSILILFLSGLELFGFLLSISEAIVFFYTYLVVLTHHIKPIKSKKSNLFVIVVFIFIISVEPTYSYYNYQLTNWYSLSNAPSNDVFSIYFYFFNFNPYLLVLIGSLLTSCTYYLCSLALYIYNSSSKESIITKSTSNFWVKSQNKSYQINRKPYLNYFFNNK